MSDKQDSDNNATQYQLVTDKRLALERLIKIANGVHDQQTALNELAMAARPSQDFPKKVISYLESINQHLSEDPVEDIIKKLDTIEAITQKVLLQIFDLAKIDVNSLRDNQLENVDVGGFSKSIDDFKRLTQTGLALRYVLNQKGVAIARFKLPMSQEDIYDQVEHLKQKEQQCIEQIKLEINSIIHDTHLIIIQESVSDVIKDELAMVHQAMIVNLEHLDKGGAINEIPHVFEVITLALEQATLEQSTVQNSETDNPQNGQNTSAKENPKSSEGDGTKADPETIVESKQIEENRSFWWALKTWISSPWSSSWSSIRDQQKRKK